MCFDYNIISLQYYIFYKFFTRIWFWEYIWTVVGDFNRSKTAMSGIYLEVQVLLPWRESRLSLKRPEIKDRHTEWANLTKTKLADEIRFFIEFFRVQSGWIFDEGAHRRISETRRLPNIALETCTPGYSL